MSRRALIALGGIAVLLSLALLASQSRVVRNAYFALQYERTLDRYSHRDTTDTDVTATVDAAGREAGLLSAFFGVDNALPGRIADWVICDGAGGQDGMPVIFSHEVDLTTLDPGDFRVTNASGEIGDVTCLTLAPADDAGELRTVLLAGEFGSAEDQPKHVEIIGNILSIGGEINFKGAAIGVVPLEAGPSIALAEIVPEDQWELGVAASTIPFGGGSGCPTGTVQILRVTWQGGVTKPDGSPADMAEARLYAVELEAASGVSEVIAPFALADTGDGDNNHKLCLDRSEKIVSISFPEGRLTDPRDDLNPGTSFQLSE